MKKTTKTKTTKKETTDKEILENSSAVISFAKKLFKAADVLRKNMDAADYKHPVLGLIFLKYISDAFNERRKELIEQKGEGADPEEKSEYIGEKIFWVPEEARWSKIQDSAKKPEIGKITDDAMIAIEKDNNSLKGVLPRDYASAKLDKSSLGKLIDLFSNIPIGEKKDQSRDVLGRIYEYFLGEFASNEGKKGGQFYTPSSVVRLLVEMIQPEEGKLYEPCCGSGGMIVQSERFMENYNGQLLFYGQESNPTTWRLCKMNLAIRAIDADIKWNNEGSFIRDEHKGLEAENDLLRIEVEARQVEQQAKGIAAANIAQAQGEAEAIRIINESLSANPFYLEWLKTQAWDGRLPLVVGAGGTPFIAIPTEP